VVGYFGGRIGGLLVLVGGILGLVVRFVQQKSKSDYCSASSDCCSGRCYDVGGLRFLIRPCSFHLVARTSCRDLIRKCGRGDEGAILHVINESAKAYRGVIPTDRYREPYMSPEEFNTEVNEMTFFGYEKEARLLGVAGYQPVKDVTLVRHLYVLPGHQRQGIGGELLNHIIRTTKTQRVLVGTWEAAESAIRFYKKHGFKLLPNKEELLKAYWRIPQRQIETSVVLMKNRWT